MDALGHALATGAVQEIRAYAPRASRWDSGMDQAPRLQRCRRGNEPEGPMADGLDLVVHSLRVSHGAVEGMNNKIKSISHRSFGFRTAENFIAAIYHCCARLPLPVER